MKQDISDSEKDRIRYFYKVQKVVKMLKEKKEVIISEKSKLHR